MLERIYGLSPRARLVQSAGSCALLCTHPLQRIELNRSAFALLQALDGATPLRELVAHTEPGGFAVLADFLEDLVTQGCLGVRYGVTPPAAPPTVEVIVPVLDNAPGVARCLAALARQTYPRGRWTVSLVDDGSAAPLTPRAIAAPPGLPPLRVIRLERNQGPASARNAALEAPPAGAGSELVAFTDSDCVPEPGWLVELAGALEEPGLAAVGGWVLGLRRDTALARYESECASLNLGPRGAPVGAPGDRSAYLPTCNLMARRTALRAAGGFTPGLRLGEDVDLSWRLRERGFRIHYVTSGVVRHEYRDRIGPFLRRKAAYASTEGWLARAHPGHQAAARRLPGAVLGLAGGALGLTGLGCAVGAGAGMAALAAGMALLLAESARHAWRNREALRGASPWAAAGPLGRRMGAQLLLRCRAWTRQHAVAGVALGFLAGARPGLALWLAAVAGAGAWGEWLARRPALKPREFLLGYALDVFGYSFGRWRSMLGGRLSTAGAPSGQGA
jgi:mycofactocin system glycosyltransferase